ncbi:hypothetical protein CERSUDRAFT_85535 [Gelatoporia subvermispora B]|uniref:Uncharacterized protein n=1 Tax=Ceriporiopsis subvermispora (strain B) TaxID=914234 RepID=M2QU33_CERS8|nr:hypothetical protein CERSUDRAFT_85535 [Gelatoporia subvermispora B]
MAENNPFRDPQREQAVRAKLEQSQKAMEEYQRVKDSGNEEQIEKVARAVSQSMRDAADVCPDHKQAEKLRKNADEFERGGHERRAEMSHPGHPLVMGLKVLFGMPVIALGSFVWGVGKVVEGLGRGLAAGPEWAVRSYKRGRAT